MSESAQTPAGELAGSKPPAHSKKSSGFGGRAAIIAAVGATLVAGAVGFTVMQSDLRSAGGSADQPTLSFVAQNDIANAAGTLSQSAAGTLVDDAKRCSIPLANITISKGTAAGASTVRIRSGNYLSPYFTVADAPQRVAIPFPAPYGAGAGTLVIEGSANGAVIGLAPTKVLVSLPGSQTIPVVWRPRNPC